MCGLGGYTNIPNVETRAKLIRSLGRGVDTRGGDAAGYVTIEPNATGARPVVHYGRKAGKWLTASKAFVHDASRGALAVLHARYATCGDGANPSQAHPFAVRRASAEHGGGMRSVLWGAHNGVLSGAEESAKAHGRTFDVDSRELFELLADGKIDAIKNLRGWGTLAWIEREKRDRIYLVKMTESADLCVARTKCGALVYASTKAILLSALDDAGMSLDHEYSLTTGKVYAAKTDGVLYQTYKPDVTLSTYSRAEYYDDKWGPADWDSMPAVRVYSGKTGRWNAAIAASNDAPAHGRGDEWDTPIGSTDYPGECPHCYGADTWAYDGQAHCEGCGDEWEWPDDFQRRVMARLDRERSQGIDDADAEEDGTDPGDIGEDATDPGEITEASDGWDGAQWIEYLDRQRKARQYRQTKLIGRLMRKHFPAKTGDGSAE